MHDPASAVDVHIADSLAGLEVPEVRAATRIADLGAGAGLPGLVLAAALPRARVVLVESAGRKCEFLREAAVHGARERRSGLRRAEEWTRGHRALRRRRARGRSLRCPVLCEYAAPLLRADGVLVAWKGAVEPAEAADAAAAAEHLGLAASIRAVLRRSRARAADAARARKTAPTPRGIPAAAGNGQ